MKNLKQTFALAITMIALTITAGAQDFFNTPKEAVLAAPATLSTIGSVTTTNTAIDIRRFTGRVRVELMVITNAGNAAVTATLQTCNDPTNGLAWSAIPNYAIAIPTSLSYTNYAWGSNVVTQTMQVPGTITTPTATSAGWTTPYVVPALFTNTGAITPYYNNYTVVSFLADDAKNYLHVVWTQSGGVGATNVTVGAILIGNGIITP